MAIVWFDSHCHPELKDLDDVLEQAASRSVMGMTVVGTTLQSSRAVPEYVLGARKANAEMTITGSCGIHPHDAANDGDEALAGIEELLCHDAENVFSAVGECGLDYYYEHSPRERQLEVFAAQIELARKYERTLVIHTRDAWSDTFEVLEKAQLPERVVFHCFVGGVAEAEACVDMGAYISLSGIVTFKNSTDLRDVAVRVPDDRLLLETDSPYLAPVPLRGQPNTPANVAIVGEFVAMVKERPLEDFSAQTWLNTVEAFSLSS